MKTPHELRVEATRIENEDYGKREKERLRKRDEFEKLYDIQVYTSDDYCGLSVGNISFYYGYEVSFCPIKSHKTEDDCYEKDCDKREWCFTAEKDGKEILKMPQSKIHPREDEEPFWYLVAGIGHYLKNLEKK